MVANIYQVTYISFCQRPFFDALALNKLVVTSSSEGSKRRPWECKVDIGFAILLFVVTLEIRNHVNDAIKIS